MKYTIVIFGSLLSLSGLCYPQTEQPAITMDGRQVILRSDKTWSYQDEKPSSTSAPIIGDDTSEMRAVIDSMSSDLAQTDSETTSDYLSRLSQILGERRLSASDHPLYQSVIVIDSPILSYKKNYESYELLTTSKALDAVGVGLVQRQQNKWTKQRDSFIRFPMSAEMAEATRPNIRLAIYGFPVSVSDNKLLFVPKKYVVFDAKTGKRYISFRETESR